eukprot:590763-Prymnesium_polylepis.1
MRRRACARVPCAPSPRSRPRTARHAALTTPHARSLPCARQQDRGRGRHGGGRGAQGQLDAPRAQPL